jgi:heat shock protein HtpX
VVQGAGERASVWIQIDEAGRQNAFIGLRGKPPAGLAEAFAVAVGCRAADLQEDRSDRPEVHCATPTVREGLRATTRWPLSRLNAAIGDAGLAGIDLYVSHDGAGVARMTPAVESRRGLFGWSHRGEAEAGRLADVVLETGFEERGAWLLLVGGAFTWLSPLLLLGVRGGLAEIQGGLRWVSLGVGTGWLWVVLATDGPAMAAMAGGGLPGPAWGWAIAAVALPAAMGVGLGTVILGWKYGRALPALHAELRTGSFAWGGVGVTGMLISTAAMFAGELMVPMGAAGLAVMGLGFWMRYGKLGGVAAPLGEGPLLERIRELAARAGAGPGTVMLVRGRVDVPAAFADPRGRILLTEGLVRELPRAEVDGIVAHELAHLGQKHGAGLRGILAVPPMVLGAGFFVPGFVTWAVWLVPAGFLFWMAMRRRQEFAADREAVRLTGDAEGLMRGLARATRESGVALDWARWAGLTMAHPTVMARVQALAAAAGIGEGRIGEIVAEAGKVAGERYEVGGGAGGGDVVQVREGLKGRLGLFSLAYPLVFSVAAPLVVGGGWPEACLAMGAGILIFYLGYEWLVAGARETARRMGEGRGYFVGISPAGEPRLYNGMFDFEWGFAGFEGDWLVLRGEQGTFAAHRDEVRRVWMDAGPAWWTARPMVCLEIAGGRTFSLRPFDGAFGWKAAGAARRLLKAAEEWRGRSTEGGEMAPGTALAWYPDAVGVPEPPYPVAQLLQAMGQCSLYVFGGGSVAQFYFLGELDWVKLGTSIALVCGLVVFPAWPGMRRRGR